MSADLLTHDLRQRSIPTAGVAVVLGGFALFILSVAAGLGDTIESLTADMPEALTAFIGGDAPGGYVVGELFSLIAPLFLVALAVLGGATASAGEERTGTMGLLAAQPVTRTAVLLSKAGSLGLSLVVVAAALFAGVAIGAVAFDIGLDVAGVAAACVHLLFLAAAFGAVALAVGGATGRPEIALGIGGGLAVASYLADSMLPLAGFDAAARLSPWYAYEGSDPLRGGVDGVHLAVLAAIAVVGVVVALITYRRRDLKG